VPYPNFIRGLSFVDLLFIAIRLTVLNANYNAKQGNIHCFDQKCKKYQKKRGKRIFSLSFLDPNSPRLAFGLPGPPNYFRVKEPACLGELVTSGVSISSPGWAPAQLGELPLPQVPIFLYIGMLKRLRRGSKGQKLMELREERKKRKRGRGATESRPRSFLTSFHVLRSSCDRRLVLFLRFECDLCTLRGPPYYYVHIHLLHLSLVISFFFVKFNLNRSLVL